MTTRRPLVLKDGRVQEIPAGDEIPSAIVPGEGGGGGGSFEIETVTVVTGSISPNVPNAATGVEMALGYRLFAITVDRPARVRLYTTADDQDDDLTRPIGIDPHSDSGVMFDYVAICADRRYRTNPTVDGWNDDSPRTSVIPMTVTNLSDTTGTVEVTFEFLRTE